MLKKSVQAQSVLYNNSAASILRAVLSIANAARVAAGTQEGIALSRLSLRLGDASPKPALSPKEEAALCGSLQESIDCRYVFFNENTGHAKGQNLLAKRAESDYLLFLNPDVIASPHALEALLQPFVRGDVGVSEGRQTPLEHPKAYKAESGESLFASGACMMIDRRLFEELGGFDHENFFMHCDDVDLCWRARLAGRKVVYLPAAPVYHARRLCPGKGCVPPRAERYYAALGGLMLAHKWSWPEALEELLAGLSSCPENSVEWQAARAFLARRAAGRLPPRLDSEHRVSAVRAGGYGEYRF